MTDPQALAFEDYDDFSKFRQIPRPLGPMQAPKLVGWRRDAFAQPHLRNQVIRRITRQRRDVELKYWHIYSFLSSQELRRQKQETLEKAKALKAEFMNHASKWLTETEFLSSVHETVLHPSYQRIIGMGTDALPLIFEELRKKPGHWFWALHAITGAEPVPDQDKGRVKKMAEHWINWGKEEGIIE